MKTERLAQNFLKNRPERDSWLILANGPTEAACIELGAGKGIITEAAVDIRGGVVAIEKDPRRRCAEEEFESDPESSSCTVIS